MERHGIACGVIFFAVHAQAVCIEPLLYWNDPEHALHDRIAETSNLAALATHATRPEATTLALTLRDELKTLFRHHGCAHVQIARSYPWAATRDPPTLHLIAAFKRLVDPANRVNPGALALPDAG